MEPKAVAQELPEFLQLLKDMKEKVLAVTEHVKSVKSCVENAEHEKGVSFLEVKNHMLLSYVINLTQLMLLKTEGRSIAGCGPVDRLVEIRTVLEKTRPLDQKLRYQIDKLIRTATTGLSVNDPLAFRPNPRNLVSKLEEEEEEEEEENSVGEEEEVGSSRVYVPPKVVATPYEEEEERRERRQQRQKQKALRSSLIQDLRNELLDAPEEVHDVGSGVRKQRVVQEEEERERYEEEHFLRLSQPGRKRGRRALQEEELTDFSTLKGLTSGEREGHSKKKKLSGRKFGKGRRKKGSRRRR